MITTNLSYLVFKQIYELSTNEYFNLFEEVIKPIGLKLYNEEEFQKEKRSLSINVGMILRKYPIFKKRTINGVRQYQINLEDLKDLIESKIYLKKILEKEKEDSSVNSLKEKMGDVGDMGDVNSIKPKDLITEPIKIEKELIKNNKKKEAIDYLLKFKL